MFKSLKTLGLAACLLGAPLLAKDDDGTRSLVGFEGGSSSINIETGTAPLTTESINAVNGGVKIGAESKNYRFFLNFNYLDASKLDRAVAYGASLQYLLNVSDYVNIFAGPNIGRASFRVLDASKNVTDVKDTYYGGDVGLNIHLGKTIDLELGGRYMAINGKTSTFEVKEVVSGYGSIIFKFQLD